MTSLFTTPNRPLQRSTSVKKTTAATHPSTEPAIARKRPFSTKFSPEARPVRKGRLASSVAVHSGNIPRTSFELPRKSNPGPNAVVWDDVGRYGREPERRADVSLKSGECPFQERASRVRPAHRRWSRLAWISRRLTSMSSAWYQEGSNPPTAIKAFRSNIEQGPLARLVLRGRERYFAAISIDRNLLTKSWACSKTVRPVTATIRSPSSSG